MITSLRRSLLIWLCVPLLLAATLLLFENYYNAHRSANNAYDNSLYAAALAIADRVVLSGAELEVDLPYIALEMMSASGDHVYYKVVGESDSLITGYNDLALDPPESKRSLADDAGFFDSQFRSQTVRVAELKRTIHRQSRAFDFTVYVAGTVGQRDELTRELTLVHGSRLLLLVVLVMAAAWLSTSRALRPVKELRDSLQRRSYHDLSPVNVEVPAEISAVVGAINQLMERLRSSFSEIHAFVDDASHQLRTPVASLRTQLEVALAEKDPEQLRIQLEQLLATSKRTSRLADQLLAHAKTIDSRDFSIVNLNELVERVTRDWVLQALERDIDLGLEPSGDRVEVECSPTLIEEVLNNLIHNAIQYCPSGSTITSRLFKHGSSVIIEVEDDGPGIPEADRDDALKRFRRLDREGTSGCGLGLAIAKEIVDLHGGVLALFSGEDGRGLRVRVALPIDGVRQRVGDSGVRAACDALRG